MPRVHLPDGRIVNFPEGMSTEQITAEVTKLTGTGQEPAQAGSPRTWTDTAVEALPAIGGAVGGLVGRAPIIGSALAGAGGIVGEGYRQAIEAGRGLMGGTPRNLPSSFTGQLAEMGKQGAVQAGAESGGRVLGGALRTVGRGLLENAVRPTATLLDEFPNVMQVIERERLPVGRGLPFLQSGSQKAKGFLRTSAGKTRELLAKADKSVTFKPQAVVNRGMPGVMRDVSAAAIAEPETQALKGMTKQFLKERAGGITPTAMKDLKRAEQAIAKPVFKAARTGMAIPTAGQASRAKFAEGIAGGSKELLETIPGVGASEKRTQDLIGATRALRRAETRRLPLWGEAASAAAGAAAGGYQGDPTQGLATWLAIRTAASPRTLSRAGLRLTGPIAQNAAQQAIRAALLAKLASDTPE